MPKTKTHTGTVGGVTGITLVYPLDTAKMRCVTQPFVVDGSDDSTRRVACVTGS